MSAKKKQCPRCAISSTGVCCQHAYGSLKNGRRGQRNMDAVDFSRLRMGYRLVSATAFRPLGSYEN